MENNLQSLFTHVIWDHYECIIIQNSSNWKYLKTPTKIMKRRQDYSKFAFIDGSFYITNVDFLRKKNFVVEDFNLFS